MNKAKRFSERIGKNKVDRVVQIDSMSNELKYRLWNVLEQSFFIVSTKWLEHNKNSYQFYKKIYDSFFKLPIDTIPNSSEKAKINIRKKYFEMNYLEVYDFIEFAIQYYKDRDSISIFIREFNEVLEEELSPYRFVNSLLTPITNENELKEISNVLDYTNKYGLSTVSTHIEAAITHFSKRVNPDFRNSIKESISAVEAICRIVLNDQKATLGKALKQLKKNNTTFHKSLLEGYEKIYGYTSDDAGIRHSLLNLDELQEEDARYFLISCSAFVNYLTVKAEKNGLIKSD